MIVDAAGYAAAGTTIQNNICGYVKITSPKSVVLNRYITHKELDQDSSIIQSPADLHPVTERPRVNGILISFVGLLDRGKIALQSLHSNLVFHFAFYQEYDSGTDEANSEKELRDRALMVKFDLWKATDLGDRSLVEGHEQLILPPQADIIPMGDKQVHYMPGSMVVRMQAAQKTP